MKKIIIANNKGGVGKTNIASQIVYALADKGHSVIGVDLDSQRNFTGSFEAGKDLGSALDLVTHGTSINADLNAGEIGILSGHKDVLAQNSDDVLLNVRNGLVHSRGAEYCVIDAPPSFSEVVYGALLGSDYLLVPIELKRFSLDGIEGVLEAFIAAQEHNPELELLGLLPSRFDAVKQVERDALVTVADPVGIICLVRQHDLTGLQRVQQVPADRRIMGLSGRQFEPDRQPVLIGKCMEFRT